MRRRTMSNLSRWHVRQCWTHARLGNINPLGPNSDQNEISLYIITACLNIQVMRIKETIIKEKMSWYLDEFSLLVPYEMYGEQ